MVPNDLTDRVPERIREAGDEIGEALVVAALAVFMLVSRLKPFEEFNQGDNVWFFGTDAYYHTRHVVYTVANFPRTLDYDALTQYPLGTSPGQFGTLFDQIAAAMAWLVGLVTEGGAPSTETVLDVMTAYPAILGALAIVPLYLLVRDLYGPGPALFAGVAAALLSGSFQIRTMAGFSDHHSIEILLSTLAVWAAFRAFRAWEAEELVLEDVAGDPLVLYREHRRALSVSLFAALAFWAYLSAWPPGVLFVGIVGLWLILQTTAEVVRGQDPIDLVVTGVTVFGFLAITMIPYAVGSPHGGFSALNFTWLQPTAPLLAALALVGMAGLAWVWRDRELPAAGYPLAALGAGLLGLGVLWVLLPDLVQQTLSGTSWVTGIGVDPTRRTISEAQPAEFGQLSAQFGWLYISAGGAFLLALIGVFAKPERRTNTLLVVWATLMTTGTFTQSRFMYYLAVVVLVLNGYLASRLFDAADVFAEESRDADEEGPVGWTGVHTGVVVLLALMLVPTHVAGFATTDCNGPTNAWTAPDCFAGPGESKLWAEELAWVRSNTTQPPLGLTDSFDPPENKARYDYPQGTYGVLSWWDYGHQIQFDGHRAPVANPFQQQAPLASEIFTADTEEQALELLDEYLGEDNEVRYLMIDDQMVSTKFGAITVWAGVRETYARGETQTFDVEGRDQPLQLRAPGETVRNWFLQDIYHNDAQQMSHFRLVKEHPQFSLIGNQAQVSDQRARLAGYNTLLARGSWEDFQRIDADKAYPRGQNTVWYDLHPGSRLKTYERVAGATLVGEGQPGTNVSVRVDLLAGSSGRSFTYEADAEVGPQGSFNVTVPYATTDERGPDDGATATNVHARGPYTVEVGDRTAELEVPEPAVLEGREITVQAS